MSSKKIFGRAASEIHNSYHYGELDSFHDKNRKNKTHKEKKGLFHWKIIESRVGSTLL